MSNLADLLNVPDASLEAKDDFTAINELYLEKGWGDGLPLIPPTEARVAAMLEYCDRPWNEPVAKVAPRYGEATPLRLAANAVMAGCKPEYFPLIVLAVEAMCDEAFNLYGIQATTHMCAPLVIVNGPGAKELGMNSGHNAFGPGTHSNANIQPGFAAGLRIAILHVHDNNHAQVVISRDERGKHTHQSQPIHATLHHRAEKINLSHQPDRKSVV